VRTGLASAVLALLAVAAPAAPAGLQDENILLPLPHGFKPGFESDHAGMKMVEFVPAAETVDDWSRMVTEQIFYGRGRADPDALPRGMAARWSTDCPGGSASQVRLSEENGYPVSIWMFLCPTNPATSKPENMWMKVIAGTDSLYSVQYAYRSPVSKAMIPPTMTYLRADGPRLRLSSFLSGGRSRGGSSCRSA